MNRIKSILAAAFYFVLLLSLVNALSIETDKPAYEKGDVINISGNSEGNVKITVSMGNVLITEKELVLDNNLFEFSYESEFLDPSGLWTVKAVTDTNAMEKTIQMKIPPKAAYQVIAFSSPFEGEHKRSGEIEINVEVTDSGLVMLGGEVVAYGALGEKLQLQSKGSGRYSVHYTIPFNAPLGEWDLTVTTKKRKGENLTGGENSIKLSIIETPILIEVVRPSGQIIGLGDKTTIVVKPTYIGGKTVDDSTKLSAEINGEKLGFSRETSGEYMADYTPKELGTLTIEFSAIDSAQNKGSKIVTIIVGGWFEFFIGQYWPFILGFIIITIFALYTVGSGATHTFRMNSLKKQREETLLKLKRIESDYYKKGMLDRTSFETEASEYKKKLTEIDEKINALTKKKEKIKKKGEQII